MKKLMSGGINYGVLPSHLREGAQRYIEDHIRPGGFLQAVISNDLREAFFRADDDNFARMADIISFFHWEAPGRCWGSKEKMEKWIEKS